MILTDIANSILDKAKSIYKEKPKNMGKYTWILDPGHGGMIDGVYQTAGKRSPVWADGTQYFEGVGNRDIVKKIMKLCEENNITCVDIVNTEADKPLKTRVDEANALHAKNKNSIYISIHSDAFDDPKANGFTVFTSPGQTNSDKIANVFFKEIAIALAKFKPRTDPSDSDPDKEENFYVLKNTTMPAVLSENLFYTNSTECKYLLSEAGRQNIANAHFKAIQYIEQNGY